MDNQSYQADQITGNNRIKLKKLNIFFGFVTLLILYFPDIIANFFPFFELIHSIPFIYDYLHKYQWLHRIFNIYFCNITLSSYVFISIAVYYVSKRIEISSKIISNITIQLIFFTCNTIIISYDSLQIFINFIYMIFNYNINILYPIKIPPCSQIIFILLIIPCSIVLINSNIKQSDINIENDENDGSFIKKIIAFTGFYFLFFNRINLIYIPNILRMMNILPINQSKLYNPYRYFVIALILVIIIKKYNLYKYLNYNFIKVNLLLFGISFSLFYHLFSISLVNNYFTFYTHFSLTIYYKIYKLINFIANISIVIACSYILIGINLSTEKKQCG